MEFDFATSAKVADLSKVPADFHPLYKKAETEGGGFILDSDNPQVKSAVSAISGLNNALKAARAEAKNKPAAVDLTLLKDFGGTPEEIKTAVDAKLASLEGQIKGVNIDKIKADLAAEYSKTNETTTNRAKALEGQLYKTLVIGAATGAIADEKGDTELLMPFVQKHVKTVDSNGEYQVAVVDQAGDIRYSGVTGNPMTVRELVKEMKTQDRYAKLFASEAPNGGGTPPGSTSRRPANQGQQDRFVRQDMSAAQKIASGLRKGGFVKSA